MPRPPILPRPSSPVRPAHTLILGSLGSNPAQHAENGCMLCNCEAIANAVQQAAASVSSIRHGVVTQLKLGGLQMQPINSTTQLHCDDVYEHHIITLSIEKN